jgi:putative peptide zinc metalloprotease protein
MSATTLAPLREDLRLLPGPVGLDGAPSWTLHDPARHRFVRIGWLEFEVVARWPLGEVGAIARAIRAETTIAASEADVQGVAGFLTSAGLLAPTGEAGAARLGRELAGRRLSGAMWLLKNYLFIRVRLLNPDRLLAWMLRWVGWMFSRGFVMALGLMLLLALHVVGEQWEAYTHSFLHLFTLEGALLAAVALSLAKVVHEFGHGLAAKRLGCRVPGMGVALLVMWPVLWTDTTDAWRLTDRKQRLAIDAAGVAAELTLAIFATLAWALLPDGPLRSAAFLLSSSTWVLTLLVNANPLMRFDGYYLLSDWLDIANLQDRGFAFARWRLREFVFAYGDPAPGQIPPEQRRAVLAYAVAAMTYRFFLFIGIAVLVYHLAFKALGLFLMGVELWWFVARPILAELRIWAGRWRDARPSLGGLLALLLVGGVLAGLLAPWQRHISAPALLRAGREAPLYVAEPGALQAMPANLTRLAEGQAVLRLDSPILESRRLRAAAAIEGLRQRIEGQQFDPDASEDIDITWQELQQVVAEYRAIEAQQAALTVRAPFAGLLADVPTTLRAGSFLPRREPLGLLIDPTTAEVEAYIPEAELSRLTLGAPARFLPDDEGPPMQLTLAELAPAAARVLEARDLASLHGGPIAARRDPTGRLIPEGAIYRAILHPTSPHPAPPRRLRGTVQIEAQPTAPLTALARRAFAVLVRESGL